MWLLRRMYWFLSFDKGYWDTTRDRRSESDLRPDLLSPASASRADDTSTRLDLSPVAAGLACCTRRAAVPPDETRRSITVARRGTRCERCARATDQVYGEIATLDGRTVHTKDGGSLDCDVLVCATGCDPVASPIALFADDMPIEYRRCGACLSRFGDSRDAAPLLHRLFRCSASARSTAIHRAAWIIRYLEADLTTEALREQAIADGDAPFLFRRGSPCSTDPRICSRRSRTMNRRLGDGLYDYADLKRHYRDIAVNHRYAPIRGVERFLSARRRRAAEEHAVR